MAQNTQIMFSGGKTLNCRIDKQAQLNAAANDGQATLIAPHIQSYGVKKGELVVAINHDGNNKATQNTKFAGMDGYLHASNSTIEDERVTIPAVSLYNGLVKKGEEKAFKKNSFVVGVAINSTSEGDPFFSAYVGGITPLWNCTTHHWKQGQLGVFDIPNDLTKGNKYLRSADRKTNRSPLWVVPVEESVDRATLKSIKAALKDTNHPQNDLASCIAEFAAECSQQDAFTVSQFETLGVRLDGKLGNLLNEISYHTLKKQHRGKFLFLSDAAPGSMGSVLMIQ